MPLRPSDWSEDQLEPETPQAPAQRGLEPEHARLRRAAAKPQEFPVPRISFGLVEARELLDQLMGYAAERNERLEEMLECFLNGGHQL